MPANRSSRFSGPTSWWPKGSLGENCEHIIYPKMYCSCQDFYKNVVVSKKRLFCKHILAQVICEALNNYKKTELKDHEFINLISNLELKF